MLPAMSRAVVPSDELSARAAESLAGPALLLDNALRIVWASPGAVALLGEDLPPGTPAPQALCGERVDRPIVESLAAGRPVTGTVLRPVPGAAGGTRAIRVRATPLPGARGADGWVLLLDADADEEADRPVTRYGMLTRDPAMKQVFHLLERAARRDVPVLVRGESGAGKELVARGIHDASPRASKPFKAINCAALPANLLESELFGHVKGSFTGAVRDHTGYFRAADGGTLFLDEIAEMPIELQAKLLRVLETHTVIPVGSSNAVPVNVRIVAATHQSLRRAVELGRFRADLMYRLRVVPIFLPPLRARAGDIPLLVQHFVDRLNEFGERRVTRIAPGAMEALRNYPWPGNVRELRNALEYAFVIGEGPVLTEADLAAEVLHPELGEEGVAAIVNAPPQVEGSPEVQRIRRALERVGGNRTRAAQVLGMSRVTLWRRMRELGIADE
jgi:transcriptional regulator with PAS, ATPase and Fis domain